MFLSIQSIRFDNHPLMGELIFKSTRSCVILILRSEYFENHLTRVAAAPPLFLLLSTTVSFGVITCVNVQSAQFMNGTFYNDILHTQSSFMTLHLLHASKKVFGIQAYTPRLR